MRPRQASTPRNQGSGIEEVVEEVECGAAGPERYASVHGPPRRRTRRRARSLAARARVVEYRRH
eukprot:6664990-Prymnesium_polylepis.1